MVPYWDSECCVPNAVSFFFSSSSSSLPLLPTNTQAEFIIGRYNQGSYCMYASLPPLSVQKSVHMLQLVSRGHHL